TDTVLPSVPRSAGCDQDRVVRPAYSALDERVRKATLGLLGRVWLFPNAFFTLRRHAGAFELPLCPCQRSARQQRDALDVMGQRERVEHGKLVHRVTVTLVQPDITGE